MHYLTSDQDYIIVQFLILKTSVFSHKNGLKASYLECTARRVKPNQEVELGLTTLVNFKIIPGEYKDFFLSFRFF